MKNDIQYVLDKNGKVKFVQIPIKKWGEVLAKLNKYEQTSIIKENLVIAFNQVKELKKYNLKKQQLSDFLNEV